MGKLLNWPFFINFSFWENWLFNLVLKHELLSSIFVSSTFPHVRENIRIGNWTKFPPIWREKMIKMNRIQRNLKNIIYILLFGVFFNFLSKLKFSFSALGEIEWNIKFSEILIEMSMILLYFLQILCNTSFLLFASLYLIIAHNFFNFLVCVAKSCCLAFFFLFCWYFDNWGRRDSNFWMTLLKTPSI